MGAKLAWEGWLLEEGRSQTGWRAPSTPSPAQPACPLATAADTCLNTYTSSTRFALKDLPKFPSPVWLLPEGERKTCRIGKGK